MYITGGGYPGKKPLDLNATEYEYGRRKSIKTPYFTNSPTLNSSVKLLFDRFEATNFRTDRSLKNASAYNVDTHTTCGTCYDLKSRLFIVTVEILHLLLSDLKHLRAGYLPDLVLIWNSRSLLKL